MYLHIGLNYLINTKHIVGIFDIENTSSSLITRKFLAEAQNKCEIINVTEELPKSFIIYNDKGKTTVYLTQFSTVTLQKRNIVNDLNI
jgi:hypothetical protein